MGVVPVRHWPDASWIWSSRPERPALFAAAAPSEMVAFRRAFRVDDHAPSPHILVTADSRYRLFLNGQPLGVGPVRSPPSRRFLDEYDLHGLTIVGENVLAALVRCYGRDIAWSLQSPRVGGLGMGGLLILGDDEVCTNGQWRCRTAAHDTGEPVGVHGCPIEHHMAIPRGWKLPGFDDSDWPAAHILDAGGGALPSRAALPSAPFTLLCGRPIPALTSDVVTADGWVRVGSLALRLPRRPPTLPRWHEARGNSGSAVMLPAEVGEDEHMTIDFGRIVVGVPAITVSAAGPATVTIVAGEILDDRGVAEIRPRLQLTRLDVDGGGMPEEVTPFDSCGFRYVTLTSTTRLSVLSVVAIEERCPSDSSARFDSDDPELNRLWTMSRRTREVCATDAYVDCPTREDRAWLGDLYVHAMVGYVVDADQRMTRWALELGASQPRDDGLLPVVAGGDFVRFGDVIPDYSLHWIRALRQYWMHTGDDTTARALVGRIAPILEWFDHFADDEVLGPVPGWVYLDANPVPGGPLGPLQALLALAHLDASELLAAVGQRAAARSATARARQLIDGLASLWSPKSGAFLDGPGTEGVVTERMQALAILCGATSAGQRRSMFTTMHRLPTWRTPGAEPAAHGQPAAFPSLPSYADLGGHCVETSPFFCHFLHQAYAAAGRRDLVLASIRRWTAFGNGGYDTVGEHWNAVGWLSSRCHGWSTTPAYDLSTHIAGVRPNGSGYRSVVVAPWLGPLKHVRARVPTPHGEVLVDVQRVGDRLAGEVVLPAGVTGTFRGERREQRALLGAGSNVVS